MPPKVMLPKTKRQSKRKASSSSQPDEDLPPSSISLVDSDLLPIFEENFSSRIVMKPHTFNFRNVEPLHIADVCTLIATQRLGHFLTFNDAYHDDFIRAFYTGLDEVQGAMFSCHLGGKTYTFRAGDWQKLFGSVFDSSLKSWNDNYQDPEFNKDEFVLSILKDPESYKANDILQTGKIKRIPRILHWIITHILRPRSGGHSRVDLNDLHLLRILLNEIKLAWPSYFVKRMVQMQESKKGTALGYSAQIMRIIKYWEVPIPPVPFITPSDAQDFNQDTLTHMGFRWCDIRDEFYIKDARNNQRIYKFDNPSEQVFVEEDPPINADMEDIAAPYNVDNSNPWPSYPSQPTNTEWGNWQPQHWSPSSHAGSSYATGSGSDTAPAYLTNMFANLELANKTRHDEARGWHNQQLQWHNEQQNWHTEQQGWHTQQQGWHNEHMSMFNTQTGWHNDFLNWQQNFQNEMSTYMQHNRYQPPSSPPPAEHDNPIDKDTAP